jgi:phosphopantothenate-cysteine ligase/phosphopantothenoylcysteine decarboxylase/phosphopantothenate--cysteine ligase
MNLLVTAGNTQTPIDKVRCITNVFTGRTGAQIALEAHRRGHTITLVTSHPEVIEHPKDRWSVRPYRTFHDLERAMAELVPGNRFAGLIHAAAVSDYHLAGTYAPVAGAHFDPMTAHWTNGKLADVSAGKVKSHHPELWLRLTPTPKLADLVRTTWAFRGKFVKFKLEVGITDAELRDVALKSRAQSDADLIVANTLEAKDAVAWIGDRNGGWERVERVKLAATLIERVCR